MVTAFVLILCLLQDDVPYKPDDTFTVKFELSFKRREESVSSNVTVVPGQMMPIKDDHSPLPYLKATLEIVKNDSLAVKYRIVRNNIVNTPKRKISPGEKVNVFAVFVDDVKDRVGEYQHTVYFFDKAGNKLNKIVIEFDEDGFYLVNGKKKGKI